MATISVQRKRGRRVRLRDEVWKERDEAVALSIYHRVINQFRKYGRRLPVEAHQTAVASVIHDLGSKPDSRV